MGRFSILLFVVMISLTSFALAEETISLNAAPSSGKAPLEVFFNLASSEEIVSVSWDFDGDGIEDSIELSPKHTYAAGKYTATANVTTAGGSTIVSTMVNVDESFSVSVIAAPSSGIAPLNVKFTAGVSGASDKEQFTYAWDFNNDGVVDSVEQDPSYVFENAGDAAVKVVVTNSDQFSVAKTIPITVSSYDSKINIVSYFPADIQLKENQITFLVANEGQNTIKDVSAKVIGEGVQHLSSTAISRLKPGEQDSLTVKINVLKEGSISVSVKIDEKIFPITFTVAEQVKVNKEELEAGLRDLKEKLKAQEDKYYEKKANGFLVSEVFDSIKSIRGQLQDAQEQILTGQLQDAQVNVNLVGSAISDVAYRLDDAKKPKQTLLSWTKDNLVAITAIIAAVGTLSGVAVKLTKGAKKLGEDAVVKLTSKKGNGKSKEHGTSKEPVSPTEASSAEKSSAEKVEKSESLVKEKVLDAGQKGLSP